MLLGVHFLSEDGVGRWDAITCMGLALALGTYHVLYVAKKRRNRKKGNKGTEH